MPATIARPLPEKAARRAREIHAAWAADPEMPETAGCMADAVRVLAIRAAVHEATGDVLTAALPAPVAVEMSCLLLERQFPELERVHERTGHVVVAGDETPWQPDDYLHRAYEAAFGPVGGRHWPV